MVLACLLVAFAAVTVQVHAQKKAADVVIGTAPGTVPQLPATVKTGGKQLKVTWNKSDVSMFSKPYTRTVVKGTAINGSKKTTVEAAVWTIPTDIVYLVDAGRAAKGTSEIFTAARQMLGNKLLNDKPDQRFSAGSTWGYVAPAGTAGAYLKATEGSADDWATSFLHDTDRWGKGIKYSFTLTPGRYTITAVHVPRTKQSYSSAIRINKALTNTQTVKNLQSSDGVHNPVSAVHNIRVLKSGTVTYETNKVGGEQWENASLSLIAVEKAGSTLSAPSFTTAGGDYYTPQTVEITHKDPQAEIYYTLDGTKPTKQSTRYTAPFKADRTMRITAVAYVGNDASGISTNFFVISNWAVTATLFKLKGEQKVNNVKLNWMTRADADLYKVYRDDQLLGQTTGSTLDDYGLADGSKHTYHVEALAGGKVIATSLTATAQPFTPSGTVTLYDNLSGKQSGITTDKPSGYKIGNKYYRYTINRDKGNSRWVIAESTSTTGLKDSWSTPRVIETYDGNLKFEGNSFRLNPKTNKVVFCSHYEDQDGYVAAKIFLAEITPGGGIAVNTKERPLGYDSRDQSMFVDDDNTAYLLSATRGNNDINIYRLDETWTRPVSLVNTIFVGQHRETPAIIKLDGVYYAFSSKASGWYPSQAMYASADKLDGVWTPLREIGNNTTFDAQTNNIQGRGSERKTYGLWSYHWGAQRHHKDPLGSFPRVTPVSFNHGVATMDYYRWLEFSDKYGIIPVQNGRNLTLNKPVEATAASVGTGKPGCVTDGAAMTSSPMYKGSTMPYSLTIDMQKTSRLNEVNIATSLTNGSEAAYKYKLEASADGTTFKTLIDGSENWTVGFIILPITDTAKYRFLRLTVENLIKVNKNERAAWADGVYELTAFGE